MKLYEIFCTHFSQIVQAETLTEACQKFQQENPEEEIIFGESVKHRKEEQEFAKNHPQREVGL